MKFSITDRGSLVTEHNGRTQVIDHDVIGGICSVMVNGRDIEDALAPLLVLEGVILHQHEMTGTAHGDEPFTMPIWPDWLGGDLSHGIDEWARGVKERERFVEEFGLTPIVVALATLEMFGGSEQTQEI